MVCVCRWSILWLYAEISVRVFAWAPGCAYIKHTAPSRIVLRRWQKQFPVVYVLPKFAKRAEDGTLSEVKRTSGVVKVPMDVALFSVGVAKDLYYFGWDVLQDVVQATRSTVPLQWMAPNARRMRDAVNETIMAVQRQADEIAQAPTHVVSIAVRTIVGPVQVFGSIALAMRNSVVFAVDTAAAARSFFTASSTDPKEKLRRRVLATSRRIERIQRQEVLLNSIIQAKDEIYVRIEKIGAATTSIASTLAAAKELAGAVESTPARIALAVDELKTNVTNSYYSVFNAGQMRVEQVKAIAADIVALPERATKRVVAVRSALTDAVTQTQDSVASVQKKVVGVTTQTQNSIFAVGKAVYGVAEGISRLTRSLPRFTPATFPQRQGSAWPLSLGASIAPKNVNSTAHASHSVGGNVTIEAGISKATTDVSGNLSIPVTVVQMNGSAV